MICVTIDELSPCLTDNVTGEIVKTEVIRIRDKSFLAGFNRRNRWYANWKSLAEENEIYALVVKGTMNIQGMVAIKPLYDSKAIFISWAVAAPHNNLELSKTKRYNGVGGHLLAIAIERSEQVGFKGDVTGYCKNKELMRHFIDKHYACFIGTLHEYQIGFFDDAAKRIREVYDYEWTEKDI